LKDNIRLELREIGWEGVDWIYLPPYRDQWQAAVKMPIKGRKFLD
jgi:hypothetical protein